MDIKHLIGFLIGLNIILTGYLTATHSNDNVFCVVTSSCDLVQNSKYALLFGIPLSEIGLLSFSLLGLCYLFKKDNFIRKIYVLGSVVGGLGAIYFLGIQAFILKSFCSTCVLVDIIAIIIAILVVYVQTHR